jgi:hypothetical protein
VKIPEENEAAHLSWCSDGLRDGGEWSASRSSRFAPRNSRQYVLYRMLVGLQIRSGHYEEEKDVLSLQRIEPRIRCRPAHRLVVIPINLSPVYKLKFTYVIVRNSLGTSI